MKEFNRYKRHVCDRFALALNNELGLIVNETAKGKAGDPNYFDLHFRLGNELAVYNGLRHIAVCSFHERNGRAKLKFSKVADSENPISLELKRTWQLDDPEQLGNLRTVFSQHLQSVKPKYSAYDNGKEGWWQNRVSNDFGRCWTPDLAVDSEGAIVCIELKHSTSPIGIYWAPVQASVYDDIARIWFSDIKIGLEKLLASKIKSGLIFERELATERLEKLRRNIGRVYTVMAVAQPNPRSECWIKAHQVMRELDKNFAIAFLGSNDVSEPHGKKSRVTLHSIEEVLADFSTCKKN